MKNYCCVVLFLLLAFPLYVEAAPDDAMPNIVAAEQASGKILILKSESDWNAPESVVWSWHPSESNVILPEHKAWFSHPDECKPALGTSHLLVSASGGGAALIRLSDKKVLFYTYAGGNPHSVELLPDGNLVSISSAGYFTVYAVPETFAGPEVKKQQYPISGGHGVVWENAHRRLWVLGYTELSAYRYNFDKENPAFEKEFSIPVEGTPASGGHDLYPVPGSESLYTTGMAVGVFDLTTRTFTTLRDIPNVKSISRSPSGMVIALIPEEEWWSPSITRFDSTLAPFAVRTGAKFYKARWWIPNHFSENRN